MEALGYGDLGEESLYHLWMLGVTPGFVRAMREAGYDDLSIQQLTLLRQGGVSPGLAKRLLAKLGRERAIARELLRLRALGLDEGYLREMEELLGGDLPIDQLVRLRQAGVTPRLVRAAAEQEVDLSPESLIRARQSNRLR